MINNNLKNKHYVNEIADRTENYRIKSKIVRFKPVCASIKCIRSFY